MALIVAATQSTSTLQIIDAIASAVAVLILAGIGRGLLGVRREFRRFMAEHMWLIATTLWTRDNVMKIMEQLGMPMSHEPPQDLPKGGGT